MSINAKDFFSAKLDELEPRKIVIFLREADEFIHAHGLSGHLIRKLDEELLVANCDNLELKKELPNLSILIVEGILSMMHWSIRYLILRDPQYYSGSDKKRETDVVELIQVIKRLGRGNEEMQSIHRRWYQKELQQCKQAPTTPSLNHFQELILLFEILEYLSVSLNPRAKLDAYLDSIDPELYRFVLVHKYDDIHTLFNAIMADDVKRLYYERYPFVVPVATSPASVSAVANAPAPDSSSPTIQPVDTISSSNNKRTKRESRRDDGNHSSGQPA
jgi:hypothetical protein